MLAEEVISIPSLNRKCFQIRTGQLCYWWQYDYEYSEQTPHDMIMNPHDVYNMNKSDLIRHRLDTGSAS